ncbi:aspartate aminotransferase family protein [uncultured Victivallis sp.]|uniref:aspartate aminotransferase family protein n=1 Tax=uncultured Victivallis sp. TaxID=354118 RepID=UPI0025D554D3|nr:aspartate aminotransferase family protein [uncultured Victivallis sp.]
MENLYETTVERYHKYVMPTYAPKILFVRGQGARLWDADGREYLDFAAGISVCNLGHCNPRVTAAIQKQAATLVHVSNLYMNEVMPRLAEKLITNCFDGVVFFANSGAEANEGMIKFARKIGNATGRNEIISMNNSFHGRTLATLAATGRAKYRKGFEPEVPGFKQVDFNDIDALKAAITDKTCAVLLEPVQGEGGILPADRDYLRQVRALCDEKNLLLLFDEVQCGMGRIGTRFAWQSFGVEPDAFSMAKAIANGLPMGGFIVQRKYADTLTVGTHASTFGGTPLVCAAALAVQEAFDQDGVLENCVEQGSYLRTKLAELGKKYSFVKEVRGMGLMIGVALDREAATLAGLLLKRNLVVLTAGETVLRLLPPLVITREEADLGLERIAAGLEELDRLIKEEK